MVLRYSPGFSGPTSDFSAPPYPPAKLRSRNHLRGPLRKLVDYLLNLLEYHLLNQLSISRSHRHWTLLRGFPAYTSRFHNLTLDTLENT